MPLIVVIYHARVRPLEYTFIMVPGRNDFSDLRIVKTNLVLTESHRLHWVPVVVVSPVLRLNVAACEFWAFLSI